MKDNIADHKSFLVTSKDKEGEWKQDSRAENKKTKQKRMPIHYSYVGKILQCDFLPPDQQSALQRNPLRKDPGPNAYKEALRFSKASGVMEYMKLDRPPPPLLWEKSWLCTYPA